MKNWKAILGIIGVFVFGMAAGGLIVGGVAMKRLHRVVRGEPLFTSNEITRRLGRTLDLDATQREHARQIVEEAQARVKAVRGDCEPQIRAALDDAILKMRDALRPEQREKFDRLVAERRAKWPSP